MKPTRFAQESAAQAQAEAQEKQQHTPGPWKFHRYGSDDAIIEIHPRCTVGGVYHGSDTDNLSHANARLIAAAPELLKAMLRLVSDHDQGLSFDITWADAKAAIAKATGK